MEKICNTFFLGKIPSFVNGIDEEIYKNILNNLLSINKGKTISVVSCWASEGKSTTLFYLAKILAENNNVALINADIKSSKMTIQKLRRDVSTKINFFTTEFQSLDSILIKNKKKYDYIFIDSPPTLEYGTPYSILQFVDSIIFLLTEKKYPCYYFQRGSKKIKDKIIGIILNKI